MRNLETSGMFAQVAEQIKGIPEILMGKKLMTLNDNEEFIAMVISFAEKKSMTISNIKDTIQEAITYLENNATLNTDLEERSYSETVEINTEAGQNYYASHEELIKRMKNVRQSVDQKENGLASKIEDEMSESCERTDVRQNKDEVMAERIFDLILRSYAPDGISVRGVDEVLRKVHEMFECTMIVPIDDN